MAGYQPRFALWSDGADKQRFVRLPACTQVDTSDMDHWSVPVGTKLWKEFAVGGMRLETRYIYRFGTGADDFFFATYVWNDAETEATLETRSVSNIRGTNHDIPSEKQCHDCHDELREHVLGFSAIQLSHAGPGLTMASLSADGWLTTPAPDGFAVPGNATARAALGYLHANCGNCHNPDGLTQQFSKDPMHLRLSVLETTVAQTGTFRTAVNVPITKGGVPGSVTHRIKGGEAAASCVWYRMSVRDGAQMPPLGTEDPDPTGLAAVQGWIQSLPPP